MGVVELDLESSGHREPGVVWALGSSEQLSTRVHSHRTSVLDHSRQS
jgi:hypothetical protein